MHPYYSKAVIVSLLPFLVILVSIIFWTVVALLRKRKDYVNRQMVSTIIIVLLLIHPTVVKTMIALFSCTEINPNEWWLTDEQDIRCWN